MTKAYNQTELSIHKTPRQFSFFRAKSSQFTDSFVLISWYNFYERYRGTFIWKEI